MTTYRSSNVKTEAEAREVVRVAKNAGLSAYYRQRGPASYECRVADRAPDATRRRPVVRRAASSEWPSLRQAFPEFFAFKVKVGDWRGNTPFGYKRRVERFVYEFPLDEGVLLGDMPVDKITSPMLGAVLDHVRLQGLGRGTQDQIRSPLVAFFQQLIDKNGLEGPNPADNLKRFMSKAATKRQREEKYDYFEPGDAARALHVAEKVCPRWRVLVVSQMFFGLRYGEAAALEIPDIDWKNQVIRIVRTWNDKTSAVGPTKSGIERTVPFDALGAPDEVEQLLRAQVKFAQAEGELHNWSPEQRRLLFPNTLGNHHRNNTFNTETWRPLLKAAKVAYRNPHTLRHTFGTWCAMGIDAPELGLKIKRIALPKLQRWMGHAKLDETAKYLHPKVKRGGRSTTTLAGLFREPATVGGDE